MTVSKEKWEALKEKMKALNIQEGDLQEKFILGSGSGGQKVQKSSTCVHLLHLPTKTELKCQKTRQREDNRFFARRLLCELIEAKTLGKKSPAMKAIEKKKKQKQRRKRRSSSTKD